MHFIPVLGRQSLRDLYEPTSEFQDSSASERDPVSKQNTNKNNRISTIESTIKSNYSHRLEEVFAKDTSYTRWSLELL